MPPSGETGRHAGSRHQALVVNQAISGYRLRTSSISTISCRAYKPAASHDEDSPSRREWARAEALRTLFANIATIALPWVPVPVGVGGYFDGTGSSAPAVVRGAGWRSLLLPAPPAAVIQGAQGLPGAWANREPLPAWSEPKRCRTSRPRDSGSATGSLDRP